MFSMEKCLGRNGTGTLDDSGIFAGGGEGVKDAVPSDEVASAVAAVSEEIGDILKDELGDAARADRIDAELADLSAELGLLAGLAEGEAQQDFTSLFEIAMGHRDSSGSSSSSWSGGRGGRVRRHSRPQRAPRRRPIAKGKEMSVRLNAAARRAACARVLRGASDASDVGADSDSDDQWTELDDACTSDSSSVKEAACAGDVDFHKEPAEAPALGQFLLPLLNDAPDPDHFLIRHEDILQLLASADDGVKEGLPSEESPAQPKPDLLSAEASAAIELPSTSAEEQAALLHYMCKAAENSASQPKVRGFEQLPEWLLGVCHSWCEISALIYTLIGTNMSVERAEESWQVLWEWGCGCGLCLAPSAAHHVLADLFANILADLHKADLREQAATFSQCLHLTSSQVDFEKWDLQRLYGIDFTDQGVSIIHENLCSIANYNDISEQIITKICQCKPYLQPLEKQYAIERFIRFLQNFKTASIIHFDIELSAEAGACPWLPAANARLQRYLQRQPPHRTQRRLRDVRDKAHHHPVKDWEGYKHECECYGPKALCAQQRKELLRSIYTRISFFGTMQAVTEYGFGTIEATEAVKKLSNESDVQPETSGGGTSHQADGNDDKPPQPVEAMERLVEGAEDAGSDGNEHSDENGAADLDDSSFLTVSESGSASSLDSSCEVVVAAAAAADTPHDDAAPGELCRTVRHLMRSISSIERLMDRVLKHCDEWPAKARGNDAEARKRVDVGLSEVDRKLMAMYRRLPEVHRRQLQVYRKQKKLSTVCMQLVGGVAPAPPAPGSPPPAAAPAPAKPLCPEYHLHRFKEVRRKVMHMRDQQLYYHRLRMWLEDQLRHESESMPDSNVTLIDDIPKRKLRTASPKFPRLSTATKRKLKPVTSISKPYKILQMLKHKAPAQTTDLLTEDIKNNDENDPPEPFALDKDDNISDTDTIVGEKETDLYKDMKECLVKFAGFALNSPDCKFNFRFKDDVCPESVSPPLQELSPTTPEPLPVYTPKSTQRMLSVHKLMNDDRIVFKSRLNPDINVPLNARRTPVLVKEDDKEIKIPEVIPENEAVDGKDPNIYKYVTFGLEIKKAMEECQNIINSYNCIRDKGDGVDQDPENDRPLSLEQICEVMMSLDKNSVEYLDKIDNDDPIDISSANTKLAELVENMPQILANMPEIASEFANASFELPEFASIMNSLPDVNNEAQLTPETLKQIRELKLNKNRDSVKVTKNTAKRKLSRKAKTNVDNDIVGTMTFEFDSKDITEMLKDEKEIKDIIRMTNNSEDFRDLIFSISTQVVIMKVFEYLKQNKNPEIEKCLEVDKDLFTLPKHAFHSELYSKAFTLFDSSVKDALSMSDLRALVKSRYNSCKHYVATKFHRIPVELLESEIEAMLDKFTYSYIEYLNEKNSTDDNESMVEKIEELLKLNDPSYCDTEDGCVASRESLKQITKLLSTSAGNTFDLLLIKMTTFTADKRLAVKSLRFKYLDVLKRCTESQQLVIWILNDPDVAANVIQDLMGYQITPPAKQTDYTNVSIEKKRDNFIERIKYINRQYMEVLPKKNYSSDEWLVLLYQLEQLEGKLHDSIIKMAPAVRHCSASEAEILAAKGLSKIIGKANMKAAKKPEQKAKAEEKKAPKTVPKDEDMAKKCKNEALLARCEAILTSKGEKSLLDSFYTIKSYITQGLPVPETYKKHVISICSSIDAKLLEEDLEASLKQGEVLEQHLLNPEELAKYSTQALLNAEQSLKAIAFKNMTNNQCKSESDSCDTPKTDCKWTNDCMCNSCKDNNSSACVNEARSEEMKNKMGLEEKKKDAKVKTPVKQAKPVPKLCENANHQQHVCKVGHTNNGSGSCTGEGGGDQHCTCCYCTVFGHAPPLTTPVPRNFNETRERLRSILNKKKQQCKPNAAEQEPPQDKKQASVQTQPTEPAPQLKAKPVQPQPKPPALPKTLPPNLTAQAQAKRQALDNQQQMLADKMAKMVVSEKPQLKPKALQRTVPIQVNVPPQLKAEGKVNPNAMEQIRLQQLKQQQQAQYQQHLQQQQLAAQQQQKKPEPIYDLPIHNKPVQQQQQIRQQQQQLQQQQLQLQQQQQQQQQQLQQQQLRQQQQLAQQHAEQQRQSRQQQQSVSMSSRDTSVFSTSSGCSGASCWRGSRCEDTRDLDALLEYIEGPARHVDRGKKRAKKQRQKAKKLESRLSTEVRSLSAAAATATREVARMRAAHSAARAQLDNIKKNIAQQTAQGKKGKKQKMNPSQASKMQQLADHLAELTTLISTSAKEVSAAEAAAADATRRLRECEKELAEVRAQAGGSEQNESEATQKQQLQQQQVLHQQKLQQQQLAQQQLQQQQQLHQQQLLEQQKLTQKQSAFIKNVGTMVCVRRAPTGAVTVSIPGEPHLINDLTVLNVREEPPPAPKQAEPQRKQTWEQALAHINQIAKGNKEKKKQKQAQQPPKEPKQPKAEQKSEPVEQPLSKKQRKLLAKQQAEEEERQRQLELQKQEAKNKKVKKAEPPPKVEPPKKQEKKEQKKVEPAPVKAKKEEKKEKKVEKVEKKKEVKVEKTVTPPAKQPKPAQAQPAQQQQQNKKEKKKEQPAPKPQPVNVTPHATAEVVSKKNQGGAEPEKPASCSIMEQLSCGVQVADLRLPPGITLTRVQPNEKKEPPPIKSVPLWKCGQLPAAPTPVARPAPVINADPSMMMFSTAQPAEPPKTIIVPDPPTPQNVGKSKKAKKKAKKATAAAETYPEQKTDGTKMVTLRNPMFHPNLPPVQISTTPPQKKPEIRVPDPIPMPPNACQATITPTSNGMYTIRNPLMSIMHQQSLMGVRNPGPQMPMYNQPQYNYVNPNTYNQVPGQYVLDPARASPKQEEYTNRIMNLASFTQKNDEGYSLFKTNDDSQQRNFLAPEYYENSSPKLVVSPNPIGTRPNEARYESDNSLFANPIQRPEPIGTPLKRDEMNMQTEKNEYTGLYTPFGQEDRNVFRSALFDSNDSTNIGGKYDDLTTHMANGDSLPYFQRLRVGSKLNNEVTIHHVTESKFYRQDPPGVEEDSLFSRRAQPWAEPLYAPRDNTTAKRPEESGRSSPTGSSVCSSGSGPRAHDDRYGAVGTPLHHHHHETSVFVPDSSITNLSSLEACEREIESFKRFEWYFSPPEHKPKVQLHVTDIANSLKQNHK